MEKNKIAIVTYHRAHNYGALLQAYALQHLIQDLGATVEFIDYQPQHQKTGYGLFPVLASVTNLRTFLSFFKKWLLLIVDFRRKTRRYQVFNDFIENNLNINGSSEFSTLILGSDQIWNYEYNRGVDPNYFGKISGIKAGRTISYAASMGKTEIPKGYINTYISYLLSIDRIGVREEEFKEYLAKFLQCDIEVNLDPTLLLSKEKWLKLTKKRIVPEKYALIYEVKEHTKTKDFVKSICNKRGLKPVILAARTEWYTDKEAITDADPCDFLTLFRDAEIVITTSFHGSVFSIIFEKLFYTLIFNNDIDIRSRQLLCSVGLGSRHIDPGLVQDIDIGEIDYSTVNPALELLRQKSINYLSEEISKQ